MKDELVVVPKDDTPISIADVMISVVMGIFLLYLSLPGFVVIYPPDWSEKPIFEGYAQVIGMVTSADNGVDFKLSLDTYDNKMTYETVSILKSTFGSVMQEEYLNLNQGNPSVAYRTVVNMHVPVVTSLPEAGTSGWLKIYKDGCAQLVYRELPSMFSRTGHNYSICNNTTCSCVMTEVNPENISIKWKPPKIVQFLHSITPFR